MIGATNTRSAAPWWVATAALFVALVAVTGGSDGPRCHEDEVVAWDGDEHSICVPVDDLLDPDRTVTFGELVAELGEATE